MLNNTIAGNSTLNDSQPRLTRTRKRITPEDDEDEPRDSGGKQINSNVIDPIPKKHGGHVKKKTRGLDGPAPRISLAPGEDKAFHGKDALGKTPEVGAVQKGKNL